MVSSASNSDAVSHARTSTGERVDRSLANDLGEMARELQAEPDLGAVLSRIATAAVSEINGARWAGISLVTNRRVSCEAPTNPIVRRLDEAQTHLQEGPCLQSLREQMTVRVDDMSRERRWPQFAADASAAGVASMLSAQLFVRGDNLGALNLYADRPSAFDESDEGVAIALAAHAAVAMKAERSRSNFFVALESRDVIGQAKGILMERYKIDQGQAFDLLVLSSQRSHRKLRDVADELTTTGELRTDKGRA